MSQSISKEYLEEVRKRASAATSGPWISLIEGRDYPLGGDSFIQRSKDGGETDLYLIGHTLEDQDFIAHARQDIPLLLDEIERLQKLLDDIVKDKN